MAFMDIMPWRRMRGGSGALENVRGLVDTVERALEEPWAVTGARLLGSEWAPRMELKETEKEVVVEAALPELDKKDIHVCASESILSIRGTKRIEPEDKGARRHGGAEAREIYTFYRSFALPASVRPDDVKASYKDGVLTVTLPKAKHSQVKRVPVS